jgi:pimeloyl-ACP methyl ester carboxylesterase
VNWLFLRGLVREQGHWGNFVEEFRKKFPDDTIICLDSPGNGQRCLEKSPTSIGAMVEAIREQWLLQRGNAGCMQGLFTISLGGMVATEWLQRYPNDFSKIVIINSSLRGYSPITHRLQWNILPKVLAILFNRDSAEREKKILSLISNNHADDQQVQKRWIQLQIDHPVKRSNALRQLLAAILYQPPQKKPTTHPILILSSGADRFVNPQCSVAIANRWNTELRVHPSAGHDLPMDAPDWILDQIRDWIQKTNESTISAINSKNK